MEFAAALVPARLVLRYKRFLTDCVLEGGPRDGEAVMAHLANPGSMMGLKAPGLRVWLEPNDNPSRKLKFTVRMVELPQGGPEADPGDLGPPGSGILVGVDTGVPNRVVGAALRAGQVPGLEGYGAFRAEVKYGAASRVDFLATAEGLPQAYVEVKNVHLVRTPSLHEFPDSVTARGAKHLGELAAMVKAGHRAIMVYCIQRGDGDRMALAADLDPGYAAAFAAARAAGVEAVALRCHVTLGSAGADGARIGAISVDRPVPIAE
ncbi:MAG: DNA/RNA nuclease SfsA [Pseudomonadota bacterium]